MAEDKNNICIKTPQFTGENVPITLAAKVMKKDQQFIRQGIIKGILPFGVAYKREESSHYDYYISPKGFWEYTGYIYKG